MTWDLGSFFWRYFLDTKAISFLSVKLKHLKAVSVFEKHSGYVPFLGNNSAILAEL